MNFAPYQDAPETTRALSPPPASSTPRASFQSASPRPSFTHARNSSNHGTAALSPNQHSSAGYFIHGADVERGWPTSPGAGGFYAGGGGRDVDMFETRLGLRMDYEACLAYLLLPPAGAVVLLVLEHRSDYVRFHAWQSSLLFTFLFVVHIIFSWTSIISWMLFACDLLLIGYLTFRAYKDAETLDRCEVPFFGPLASSILDDE